MGAIPGQLETVASQSDARSVPRRKLLLKAQEAAPGRSSVFILDISTTGLLLQAEGELALYERIELELPGSPPVETTVRWSRGGLYGCQFVEPVSDAFVSAALLRSDPHPTRAANLDALHAPDRDGSGKLSGAARIAILVGVTTACWLVIAAVLMLV